MADAVEQYGAGEEYRVPSEEYRIRGAQSAGPAPIGIAGEARHRAAVASTLKEADEAAASGDYAGALSWLDLIEAIGDELPGAYKTKRRSWRQRPPG